MIEENHEKTPVRLVGTGIRTRDLPHASLVRYHGATSLGIFSLVSTFPQETKTYTMVLVDVKELHSMHLTANS